MTRTRAPLGTFEDASPAAGRLGLLPAPVAEAVAKGWGGIPADRIVHVDTDPAIADTAVFVEHYGPELLGRSADCVVVAGKRGGGPPWPRAWSSRAHASMWC